MHNKTRTQQILIVVNVLAWVAFIGFMIRTGALMVTYGLSWVNPDAARNLYRGLDLAGLCDSDFLYYSQAVSFLVAFDGLKALLMYFVIRTLSNVNLASPFSPEVGRSVERISWVSFGIWVVAVLNNAYGKWLMKISGEATPALAGSEFFFMAGLVFVISQIFRRGLELQSENELTV